MKAMVKKLAKSAIHTYRICAWTRGSNQKLREYLALHQNLQPLPQEHAQKVAQYWEKIFSKNPLGGGGNLKNSLNTIPKVLGWHTAVYNANKEHPLDIAYLHNPFYYYYILPYFNSKTYSSALADKNLFDCFFSGVSGVHIPRTILRRVCQNYFLPKEQKGFQNIVISESKAIDALHYCLQNEKKELIIKPTREIETAHGHDVRVIKIDTTKDELKQLFALYKSDFIVQERIITHAWLAAMNPKSVNTFRINTFFYKGKVYALQSTLLIGGEKITSNGGNYRIGIKKNANGEYCLRDFIIKGNGISVSELPNAQIDITQPQNKVVPHFDKILEVALQMHACVPHFGVLGWDFTLDSENNPTFIEFNSTYPGSEIAEFLNGPFFGEFSDEVYEEVADFYKKGGAK